MEEGWPGPRLTIFHSLEEMGRVGPDTHLGSFWKTSPPVAAVMTELRCSPSLRGKVRVISFSLGQDLWSEEDHLRREYWKLTFFRYILGIGDGQGTQYYFWIFTPTIQHILYYPHRSFFRFASEPTIWFILECCMGCHEQCSMSIK